MEKTLKKQTDGKEVGGFQRFIFWGLIPLLFALFIGVIVASVAGVNVFDSAKKLGEKLPFLTNDTKENKVKVEDYENEMIRLDAEILNKNAQIEQLNKKIESNELEKEDLLLKQEQLENTIEELKAIQTEQKRAFKEIVSTYESMNPKKSAPIIVEMKEEEALKVLSNVKTDTLAKILENMTAEQAASYLEKLSANQE